MCGCSESLSPGTGGARVGLCDPLLFLSGSERVCFDEPLEESQRSDLLWLLQTFAMVTKVSIKNNSDYSIVILTTVKPC